MFTTITLIQSLWSLLCGAIGGGAIIAAWILFFFKKERRLFKNMKRPICIIGTEANSLEHEASLIDRVGFFCIDRPSTDTRVVDTLNDHRLVVIGYSPNSTSFIEVFNAVKARLIPIIVFAAPSQITDEDVNLIKSYSHVSICNAPTRLISDVFAIMSTYPEDLK